MLTVDLHHHAPLASYVRRLTAIGVQAQPGVDFPSWQPADSIAFLDELGIDVAVLSVGSPGFFFGDQQFTTELCRDVNDELTGVVQRAAGRLAALVCLPLPSVEAALAELDRVWSRPEFVGVTLLTNYAGHYLGHASFAPLLAELDARAAVVHVHPKLPAAWPEGELPLPPSVLEYLFDSTRTITSLMLARVSERYPRVRWVFSHCGGTMPSVARRLVLTEPSLDPVVVPEAGLVATLRQFHYDCALSTTAADLGALLSVVDSSQVVLGSDFPFSPKASIRRGFDQLAELVSPTVLEQIRSANAATLLPQLPLHVGEVAQ
jgi:predicted TIM-barrel fold metal-dependent hydrolase